MTTTMSNKRRRKLSPYTLFLAIFLAVVALWLAYFLLSLSLQAGNW